MHHCRRTTTRSLQCGGDNACLDGWTRQRTVPAAWPPTRIMADSARGIQFRGPVLPCPPCLPCLAALLAVPFTKTHRPAIPPRHEPPPANPTRGEHQTAPCHSDQRRARALSTIRSHLAPAALHCTFILTCASCYPLPTKHQTLDTRHTTHHTLGTRHSGPPRDEGMTEPC
jgi:hypothetical protein